MFFTTFVSNNVSTVPRPFSDENGVATNRLTLVEWLKAVRMVFVSVSI